MAPWLPWAPRPARFAWPVALVEEDVSGRGLVRGAGRVVLRPLRRADEAAWRRLREEDGARLRPWEATLPPGSGEALETFPRWVRSQDRLASRGAAMSLAVVVDGDLAGQVTVAPVEWGSVRSGAVGYWVAGRWAGRGVGTLALAMVLDHVLGPSVGLHRAEVNVRPENGPSLAVVRKLLLREEGLRRRYMHIDGQWADHRSFAVTAEERGGGFVSGLERRAAGLGVEAAQDLCGE